MTVEKLEQSIKKETKSMRRWIKFCKLPGIHILYGVIFTYKLIKYMIFYDSFTFITVIERTLENLHRSGEVPENFYKLMDVMTNI